MKKNGGKKGGGKEKKVLYFLENIYALSQNTFWGTDFFFYCLKRVI